MTIERRQGLRQAEPQTQKERDIEAEIRRIISKAMKKMVRELEETPRSITIEAREQSNGDEQRICEVTAWLFNRRRGNGTA